MSAKGRRSGPKRKETVKDQVLGKRDSEVRDGDREVCEVEGRVVLYYVIVDLQVVVLTYPDPVLPVSSFHQSTRKNFV